MEDSLSIIRSTLNLFFFSLIFFSFYYYILILFIPYSLFLHFISTTSFTLLSLFLIFIVIKDINKYIFILSFITIIILIEELLLISLYIMYGLILNILLIIFLPLFANFLKDKNLKILFESLALILISRTVLVVFPSQFLISAYSMIILYSFLLITIVIYLYIRKIPNEDIRLYKGNSSLLLQIIIGLIVGIFIGIIEYYVLKLKITLFKNLLETILYVIFVMILVGFAEEILFRGMLQTYLEKIIPKSHAIFLASLIFGLMHIGWLNPWEVILAYGAGLVFGLFAYFYNSLATPVSAHFYGNVTLYLIAIFFTS